MASKGGLPRLELQCEEKSHVERGQSVMVPEHLGEFIMTEEDKDDSDDGEDDYDRWHSHEEEGGDQMDDQEKEEQEEDEDEDDQQDEEEEEQEGDEDEDSSEWLNQSYTTSSSNQPISASTAAPVPAFSNARKSLPGIGDGTDLSDLQVGNDSARVTAFLVALYLKSRLSLKEAELKIWCKNPLFNRMKGIATEIRTAEPKLRNVSVDAIVKYHARVIMLYRNLMDGLQAGAYPDWAPTHFSDIVHELCIIENNTGIIQKREQRKEKRVEKMQRKLIQQMEQMRERRAQARIDRVTLAAAHTSATAPGEAGQQGGFKTTEAVEDVVGEDEEEEEDEIPITTQPAPAGDWMQSSHPASGLYQRPGMDYFVQIFKDPPNVNVIMACVRLPPVSMEAFKHAKRGLPADRGVLDSSYLQLGDDTTRVRAFVAALYLRHRLSLKEEELRVWCNSPLYNRVKGVAREIRTVEPRLQGFSANDLVKHYESVIAVYRRLEEGLQAGAYPNWIPTHFSNIARELTIIENNTGMIQLRLENEMKGHLESEKQEEEKAQKMKRKLERMQRYFAQERDGLTTTSAWAGNTNGLSIPVPGVDWNQGGSTRPLPADSNSSRPTIRIFNPVQVLPQRPGMEYFVQIFKDPLNAGELLRSVHQPPTSLNGYDPARETTFLAALYLRSRLSLSGMELATWCKKPLHKRLNEVAREIRAAEPRLRGFPMSRLVQYHHDLVETYRNLEMKLRAGAYPEWAPTYFSNVARDLWIIESNTGLDGLRVSRREEKRQRRAARKEQKMVQQAEQSRAQTRNGTFLPTVHPIVQPTIQPTVQPTTRPTVTLATVAQMWTRNDSLPVTVHRDAWHEGGFVRTQAEGKDDNEEDESDEGDLDEDEEDNDKVDPVSVQPVLSEGITDAPRPRPGMRFEDELRDVQGIVAALQATVISQNQEIALLKQELLMQREQCEMSSSQLLARTDPQRRQTSTLYKEGTHIHLKEF
ncbi:hypothetical protein BGX34_009481 [Mortierella sp. NVP85]|nr:hypothetical protein BGX34_009481 [Mortierella sp. NVP85]